MPVGWLYRIRLEDNNGKRGDTVATFSSLLSEAQLAAFSSAVAACSDAVVVGARADRKWEYEPTSTDISSVVPAVYLWAVPEGGGYTYYTAPGVLPLWAATDYILRGSDAPIEIVDAATLIGQIVYGMDTQFLAVATPDAFIPS